MSIVGATEYTVTFNFDQTKCVGYKYNKKLPYISENGNLEFRKHVMYSTDKIDDLEVVLISQENIINRPLVDNDSYYTYHYIIRAMFKRSLRDLLNIPHCNMLVDRYMFVKENKIKLNTKLVFDHSIRHNISIDGCNKRYYDRIYRIDPISCTFTLIVIKGHEIIDDTFIRSILDAVVESDNNNVISYSIDSMIEHPAFNRPRIKTEIKNKLKVGV